MVRPAKQLIVVDDPLSCAPRFERVLEQHGIAPLTRGRVRTLQINVGKRCNQACHHCHVEAGPKRTEVMERDVVERLIDLVRDNSTIEVVDITGGAPELNPHFRYLVEAVRALDRQVIDRCNLTILFEPGMDDLAEFLARNQVHVVASLPCYSKNNVDKQRGKGVFGKSIAALEKLNALGYGRADSPLRLDLVYNPLGASLPPPQQSLQAQYKRELFDLFGIEFHQLLTITNMPIKRFAHMLEREEQLDDYMSLLVNHFNPGTVSDVMCRSTLSVGYDGELYDCDFNQMLDLPLGAGYRTIWDVDDLAELADARVTVASHCLGCTAGAGSSCSGALQ